MRVSRNAFMTNYLHTRFDEIEDAAFHQMIDELYHCVSWRRDDAETANAFYLLSAICRENRRALSERHLPAEGILTTKLAQLPAGSVYDFLRGTGRAAHTQMDLLASRSVVAVIARCFPRPPARPKRSRPDAQTRIILLRRANGDL